MKKLTALLVGLSLLAGCSNGSGSAGSASSASSANPFGWGSGETRAERRERRRARREARRNGGDVVVQDTRAFVAQVTDARGDVTKGGIILRATGLASQQGFWAAELVPVNDGLVDENGTLAFEFRVERPEGPIAIGTQRSREIEVGTYLSAQSLANVKSISVIGAQNIRTVRRR